MAPAAILAETFSGPDNIVDQANQLMAAEGFEYRIAYAEYFTTTDGELGSENVIIARDLGNKRLSLDFIPNDPRRGGLDGDPNTIDVLIDRTQGATASGVTEAATTGAITAAMNTWDGQRCSALGMNVVPVDVDVGLVQRILGFGGTGVVVPDIMHAGWLPGAFFDRLAPGGSGFILGVAFTLTFNSGDLDGDGNPDLAAREIYYNDGFDWSTDETSRIDVETVALHEAGHGLSQAHFGTVFRNPNSGKVVFAPRAVMNAVYSGVQRDIKATDGGGHCGIWANWPQN